MTASGWSLVFLFCGAICTAAVSAEGITATPIARSGSVHEGDTIMITCCTSEPVDGYEWSRLDGPEMPSKAVGVNSSTLFIPSASVDDVGLYSCSGFQANQTYQWDPVQSDPVQIWIAGGQYASPQIVSYSASPIVEEGSDLTINCTATGFPTPMFQWKRQYQAMPSKALGVTSPTLTIPNITMEDGGSYICTVSNPAGSDESIPIVPILIPENTSSVYDPPVVVFVPEDPLFEEGGTLMLKCCAQGKPLPSYAWRRLDEEMTSKAVGTTSRHLFIPNTTMSDIGVYACVAINEGGIVQSSSIQTFFRSYEPPAIGSVSSSMTVDDGTDVRLNCSATGFPSPSYQWRKLDGVIPSTAIGVNSSTLLLPGIGEEGGGVYTCSATNFIGSAESSSIQITVIPPFYESPSINFTTPTSTIEEGSDLTLMCSATGTPSPNYNWIRLDQSIPSKAQGVESEMLVIPRVEWSDVGVYACLASNEAGRAQSRPIYVIMQARAGNSISGSIPGNSRDRATQQAMIVGSVIGTFVLVAVTFGTVLGVVCFKRGLFGISSSYSIQNVSVWDVMVGKNKGQNLLDLIVRVESQEPQGIMASESSDSVFNDPRVTWEIRRPYES